MTSTWEMSRKGKSARISFVDERVIVVIDDVQVTIANPTRRGTTRRHKYWACEAHCVRIFDRAAAKIEEWRLACEAKELESVKEHAYA